MAISIHEFQVAMETFGAKRLQDRKGRRFNIFVPCFEIADYVFYHSGSYYIVHNAPDSFIDKAMKEFDEIIPGGYNFWYGEIHSVKGLLTVACMLENRYTKELIEELTSETYKKLFDSEFIRKSCKTSSQTHEFPFMKESKATLMLELCRLIDEYDNIVNPFTNPEYVFKPPREYTDKINIEVIQKEPFASVCLSTKLVELKYVLHGVSIDWSYTADSKVGQSSGFTFINHFYENDCRNGKQYDDEIVYLWYTLSDDYEEIHKDIDLRISLKTGLAWKTNEEEKAKIATQKEIKSMIRHLKRMIKNIKREIIDNMIEKNS